MDNDIGEREGEIRRWGGEVEGAEGDIVEEQV